MVGVSHGRRWLGGVLSVKKGCGELQTFWQPSPLPYFPAIVVATADGVDINVVAYPECTVDLRRRHCNVALSRLLLVWLPWLVTWRCSVVFVSLTCAMVVVGGRTAVVEGGCGDAAVGGRCKDGWW
jgi:hypothetical protein